MEDGQSSPLRFIVPPVVDTTQVFRTNDGQCLVLAVTHPWGDGCRTANREAGQRFQNLHQKACLDSEGAPELTQKANPPAKPNPIPRETCVRI